MLRFRPRGPARRPAARLSLAAGSDSPVDDLAKYERNETSDDYRHRMTMDLLTLAFAMMLIAGGVWLTTKLVGESKPAGLLHVGAAQLRPHRLPSRSQE